MRKLEIHVSDALYVEICQVAQQEGLNSPEALAEALLNDRAAESDFSRLIDEEARASIRAERERLRAGAPTYTLHQAMAEVARVRQQWESGSKSG